MRTRITRSEKRERKTKIARITILFITVVIFIIGATVVVQKNLSTQKEVDASVIEQSKSENLSQEKSADENSVKQNSDEENSNIVSEKKSDDESITKDNNNIASNENVKTENDDQTNDVAFVEKYLAQQYKGIKPDGADGRKIVYLTFDDGPSQTVTPEVLDVLKEENVKATFFIVGQAIDKNDAAKEILKREVEEGHAIGNHTYSHNYKYLYPNRIVNVDNFMADIEKTNNLLKSVLGNDFSTRAIRFPGGHMSWKGMKQMDEILASKDYHQVDWNALSKDAEGKVKKAPELLNEVIKSVQGREKAVILMHDTYGKEETAKALPQIIKYLKEQGYEFRIMK